MARSFFGGVHPQGWKHLSCEEAIVPFPAPKTVVIPMNQHIGAPCKPVVRVGQHVDVGQLLGDNEGLCVPVHASVSGTVKKIQPCPHPNGMLVPSVVIENDFQNTLCENLTGHDSIEALSPEELMELIRKGGIVGMGGATFPTHVKLSSGLGKVDTIIVNCAECEPYITADDRLLREQPERVVRGLQVIMKIFGLQSAYLGIEDNKKAAIAALQKQISGTQLHLQVLKTRYPQGAEKQLIQAITGRQVPPGGLPAAVGCAVFNCATCAAIADCIYDGLPLVRRVVSVTGRAVKTPKNYLVPIGTRYSDLLEAVGLAQTPYKVLTGGPMMGLAQYDLTVPVIKGTNAVTVFSAQDNVEKPNPHCIRCGRCVRACPMHLMPLFLYQAERNNDLELLEREHMADCIECGCCSYICPAKLPLVQSFRAAKQKLRDKK